LLACLQSSLNHQFRILSSPLTNSSTKAIAGSSQQQMQIVAQQQQQQQAQIAPPPAPLLTTIAAAADQELVDLKEWCNHRVLAKRKDIYVPGVIRPTDFPSSVLVELDFPEGQQQLYQDIFASGRFDVISDASPSLNDVSLLLPPLEQLLISLSFFVDFYWTTCLRSNCDS